MKKILLNSLPHVLAIVLFLVVSMGYFSPIMDGYDLRQGDIDNWKGMSKETMDYRMMNGEEALWTDSMFGSMVYSVVKTGSYGCCWHFVCSTLGRLFFGIVFAC